MPIATLDNRKKVKTRERKTGFNKIAIFSQENIAARKARENGSALVVSGQSPLTEKDVKPFMPAHTKAADQAVDYMTSGLNHISQKFNGVRLYALTETAVQQSVAKIGGVVFQEQAARELVNTLMRNMDAHRIFSEKLTRVRVATLNNDVAVLVDELLDFAKFFNPELWDRLNVVSETIWDKTGFALGKFTTDFHLKWKRLLRDPFVESVMGSVAEAAKSLASYRSVQAEFLQKRKAIESEIGKAPALENIRSELAGLYEKQARALAKCGELRAKLSEGKNSPKNAPKITEKDVETARTQANELDYAIEKATTRYSVAVESVLTADENADVAKLPGIAIQMHVRAVADLFFTCSMFVLNAAALFTVQNLLVSADQAQGILQKGKEVAKAYGVSNDIGKLSEITKGAPEAKVIQSKEKAVVAHKEAQDALNQMQAPVRIVDKHGEESYELIWYCFQTLSESKFCKLCEREIAIGEMVARPHYCEHKTGGEPEHIKVDGKPVVKNWYVCHECFTELTEKRIRWEREGKKVTVHDLNCGV
jgi:hypothetical protein